MSGHSHYQTFRSSAAVLPALVLVLFLEAPAVFLEGRLAVGAHSFDVLSDVLAFLIVIFGALFSGLLDDRGRKHKDLHREQKLIAGVNLLVIWIGALLILGKSIASFESSAEELGLRDWWVVSGPLVAVGVYWFIGKRLEAIKDGDLTAASLDAHVRGDVAVSAVALLLTALSLIVHASWINSIGGIAMSAILFYVSRNLIGNIREATSQHEGVLTKRG